MENKKMIETIEKKLEVTVEKVLEVKQEEKDIIVDVKVGKDNYRKVVLREMKNQYGSYYKIVSDSQYIRETTEEVDMNNGVDMEDIYDDETIIKMQWGKVEDEKPVVEKKKATSLKTKTERLCGARRNDIIEYAKKTIGRLLDGSATFKEIEGAAKEDTVIRFVLTLNSDGSRVKEDLEISNIRAGVCVG